MRTAILTLSGSPWMKQIVRRLSEIGHQIIDIELDDHTYLTAHSVAGSAESGGSDRGSNIRTIPITVGRPYIFGPKVIQMAMAMRRALGGCASDMLLTLYGGNFALAAWLSRIRPYTVYVVGSDVLFMRGFKRVVTRIALGHAAAVFVNGNYLSQKTRELAPRASIHPLLMGVDIDRFSPMDNLPNPIRIVCTRAFKPVYDNKCLIEACRLLDKVDADFRVTFTSAGPLLEEARLLAEQSLSRKMRQRVEFFGGVSDDALREIVRQSHVYVSMSLSDGTSTSLLEAMACGVFPVVSDIPQNREWIDPDADTGILVPIRRPDALADALRRAMADPALRERAAGPNRERVVERGNSRVNMKTLSVILESLVRKD